MVFKALELDEVIQSVRVERKEQRHVCRGGGGVEETAGTLGVVGEKPGRGPKAK